MHRVIAAVLVGGLCLAGNAMAQEPRFDANAERCLPYRPGVLDRQWQVSAPRNPHSVGQALKLGLRDKYGDTGQRLAVRARVVGAAASVESRPVTLTDDNFANVEFPADFPSAKPLAPGAYTVLWLLADGGGYLSCDGFVIR